ncbi:hypothetical protein CLAIMM_14740 [Cladophialophora immunda]|nr:hypothetical protein CLAIMM_14740 [Cladophialophora immunda]
MSLRHPPRLDVSEEDGTHLIGQQVRHGVPDEIIAMLARANRQATAANRAAKIEKESVTATKADPLLPPVATDFGPETLIEYLRSEADRLRRERKATSGKGKGKAKEALTPATSGVLHPSSTPISTHDRQPAVGPATRRSQRLACGDSLNQEAIQPAGESKKTPLSRPLLPTPFRPELSQQPSIPEDDLTTRPSGTGPSRTSTFEEHTRNKRMAVRNTAQKDLTSPLLTRSRQRRRSKGFLFSGASTAVDPTSSATHSELPCPDTPQYDAPESPQISLSENEPSGSTSLSRPIHDLPNSQASKHRSSTSKDVTLAGSEAHSSPVSTFDYASLIPEVIPPSAKKEFIDQTTRAEQNSSADYPRRTAESSRLNRVHHVGPPSPWTQFPLPFWTPPRHAITPAESDDPYAKDVPTPAPEKHYPRLWKPTAAPGTSPTSTRLTRIRSSRRVKASGPESSALQLFDVVLWTEICRFLSTQDVRNLRLVNRSIAQIIAPIQFRSVVVNFDRHFFGTGGSNWDSKSGLLPTNSMFKKYGANINKFGVSFEYDQQGLSHAKTKTIDKEQDAWFGTFKWPIEQYPRFPELQALEDLVDHNCPLLKEALESITGASELGLCIDSGHGWLEGPDISDMALFNRRMAKGSKVFGKTFETEDVWITFARNEYFRWAQQNTINAALKALMTKQTTPESAVKEFHFLDALRIRDIESFRNQDEQYDYDPECHVGGGPVLAVEALADDGGELPTPFQVHQVVRERRLATHSQNGGRRSPQWPLIFSGQNLAAEHGGHCPFVQKNTANPVASPLLPGLLTEPQAQWLMETVWAQRAFLSAYTTAIITHRQNFQSIHTLRISKLSSGLLPCLEQEEFWKSFSGLKTLQILVSPDWRQEHVTGDRLFAKNMRIWPSKAAERFTEFLRTYVAKIENLHSLNIGYTGGGEHAAGMFARNKHVLHAPITHDPGPFLIDDTSKPTWPLLTKFDHVRELKFENCWFTPWMLQEFMKLGRDTSLHSLILDSVSMTACHDDDLNTTIGRVPGHLRCLHPLEDWTQETLPIGASWARVLDAITPGKTLLAHKYDAGLIDIGAYPKPKPTFRGHVQEIILNSCGYVKINVPISFQSIYNQNALVQGPEPTMDDALAVRRERFYKWPVVEGEQSASSRTAGSRASEMSLARIMMSESSADYATVPWLGTLTQCIHPIEKRVLEQAWQMTFGWPNNLDRWAAVEDGQSEGGTGRFSGVIRKADQTMEEY